MAFSKFFNLFALSSLAVLVCNLGATPVTALAHDGHHMLKVRRAHGHDAVMKRKRDSTQRCKPRPSSTTVETPAETPDAASTPASSEESQPSPSPSSSTTPVDNSGKGKVGVAWALGDNEALRNIASTDNVHYLYTWSEYCPPLAAELGLECTPMLWGRNDGRDPNRVERFQSTVTSGYARIALGFNEPNEEGQANMGVDEALQLWWNYLEPLHDQGYQLLAPVTSSRPNGFDWVKEFRDRCTGCHIAGYPLHYYGTSADDMITYIEKWQAEFGGPFWVTEFACQNFNEAYENNGQQCSESQVWEFYKKAIGYMESNDNIVSWDVFGFMHDMSGVNDLNRLLNSDGSLTALGSAVVNVNFN